MKKVYILLLFAFLFNTSCEDDSNIFEENATVTFYSTQLDGCGFVIYTDQFDFKVVNEDFLFDYYNLDFGGSVFNFEAEVRIRYRDYFSTEEYFCGFAGPFAFETMEILDLY